MKSNLFIFLILLSSLALTQEKDSWVIDDIRITGLQRVSAGSVFAVMPLGLGDVIDTEKFKEVTLSIFETGKFDDIKLGRDGNALLIDLVERPTIDEIFIEGNKQIKTDALLDGWRLFQASTLEQHKSGDEFRTGYLKYEFFFEKIEEK